ncbi:MAG TPA: VacJ family lipoprotein [Woeseiaceae bacterium]|nr:VacJ family lipoprotein [Woeseiaceae bacterium]
MSSARLPFCLSLIVLACGCATQPAAPPDQRSAADPWEPMNRHIHGFNDGLDKVSLKPLAKGYEAAFPPVLRTGVSNFSQNLRTPLNMVNQFLQGKARAGFSEAGRFLANSTFGLGGLLDVATDMGLEQQNEDFGQTLAVWGVPDGPYVVVPILGPHTLRDTFAIPLNFMGDLLLYYDNASVRDKIYLVRLVDVRQRLFAAEEYLEDSTDRYLSIRESYLQNREYRIYDGNPPAGDDFYDEYLEEELIDDDSIDEDNPDDSTE